MTAILRRDRNQAVLRGVLTEVWPVVVVAFAGIIAVGHIVSTGWEDLFFYNGDSLVLGLVEQSFQRGEPFQWVFSSQIFLFPEALFYAISTLFTENPRVAFVTNACLNLLALYGLLRMAAHLLSRRARHRFIEITIALGATLVFVIFVLLEPVPSPNRSGIATPFLFTTYYYGVVLGGLAIIVLTLWVTRSFSSNQISGRSGRVFVGVVACISILIGFSNLLFAFQVAAPLWLTLLILVFMNRISWRFALLAAAPTFVGLLGALLLRQVFSELFASSVANYISIRQIPESIVALYETFQELISSPEGFLKLLLIGAIMLLNFGVMVFAFYAQSRPKLATNVSTAEVFIVVFVGVSTLSLLFGSVAIGAITTRYLQPLFIFPLLTCVVIGVYLLRRLLIAVQQVELRRSLARFAIGIAAAGSGVVLIVGLSNLGVVLDATRGDSFAQADCLDRFVGDSDLNGVASFWTARPLQLYGDHKGEILQVQPDFTVYPWMINLASYDQDSFSYVVYDESGILTREGIRRELGEPAKVIACDGYEIHDYRDTPGEQILSERIRQSLAEDLKDY